MALENNPATVDFICVDPPYIERGRDIREGYGALKLNGRRWAYCSAALPDAPHRWQATGGVEFEEIRQKELPDLPKRRDE